MARELFANNASSTLASGISSGATSFTVATGIGALFPAVNFNVIIDSEFLRVSSRSGDVFTCTRGTDGSSAASHSSGAAVTQIVTNAGLKQLRLDAINGAMLPGCDTSLSTKDDFFDDDLFSGWTQVDPGSPTVVVTEKNHFCSILHPGGGSAAHCFSWLKAYAMSPGDTVEAAVRFCGIDSNYPIPYVTVTDGVTYNSGTQQIWGYSPNEGNFANYTMTGFNTLSSVNTMKAGNYPTCELHLRLEYQGSGDLQGYYSPDGVSWGTGVFADATPITPAYAGFGFTRWGGAGPVVFSFRYCKFKS